MMEGNAMKVIATTKAKGAVMKYPSHLWNASQANTTRPICVRPDEAAAMLGISRSTLDRLTSSGKLKAGKIRGAKIYAVTDLEALVETSRGSSVGDPNASSLAGAGINGGYGSVAIEV
jgi:excisionase family DNA binding protein